MRKKRTTVWRFKPVYVIFYTHAFVNDRKEVCSVEQYFDWQLINLLYIENPIELKCRVLFCEVIHLIDFRHM